MAKFCVEIANKHNRNHTFHPTQETLRGRWVRHNIQARTPHESIMAMPEVIPGIMLEVEIDGEKRVLRRIDPLSEPEHAETWKKIEAVQKRFGDFLSAGGKGQPWPPVVVEKASHDQLKTWLYWMRRLVDSGAAEIVASRTTRQFPTIEEITEKMPGLTQIGQFNDQVRRPLYREHFNGFGEYVGPPTVPASPAASA